MEEEMKHEWDYSYKELDAIKTMVKELHHWYGYDMDNFKISEQSVIFWDENIVVEIQDRFREYTCITKVRPMCNLNKWSAEEHTENHYICIEESRIMSEEGKIWHKRILELIDKVWDHVIDTYIEYTSK